jgi:hypothetical protein
MEENVTSYNSQNDSSDFDSQGNLTRFYIHDSISVPIAKLVSYVASGFMVFGGVVPYIPQYQMIRKKKNAAGFSTLVCLSLLIANILRILFWFGHWFEYPLLAQSIIMIITMFIMLELCINVESENTNNSQKKFFDFDIRFFWEWTEFSSYLQFIFCFTAVAAFLTYAFIDSSFFIEFLGNFYSEFERSLFKRS